MSHETPNTAQLPGYQVWVAGGNREQAQQANRDSGHACYCASIRSGWCDFCTGLRAANYEEVSA